MEAVPGEPESLESTVDALFLSSDEVVHNIFSRILESIKVPNELDGTQ